ncbi:ArsB/NhaD family transporter [Candidatus Nitrosotenuis sp. DW1]|uniref:SLC13 family permease n=1 Tax=Candidatus Nitrosotenuis sp. DW1 TaxID=2259672 RepID=UPI0015CB960A|nr:SLC13 family permease [Candidatus Nitrosotenuis sp. DW1]QLH09150.1 citrate transporter [Candidatus Nitrosotenuis sp. DW1]
MDVTFATAVSIVIFVIVYGLIAIRNIRGISLPMWLTMSAGALAVLLLQIIPPDEAYQSINFDVIFFLIGMFILVSGLEASGLLKYITIKILEHAKTPDRILWFILLVLGVLSAFLINDTMALVATPIILGIAKQMQVRSAPLLITLAFGITIGSMMTPMGNPQNLLISLSSGLEYPFWTFLQYLGAPTLACIGATYVVVKQVYKKELAHATVSQLVATKELITDFKLARTSSIITIIVIVGFFAIGFVNTFGIQTDLNFSHISLVGGLTLFAVSAKRKEILYKMNWQIIVFFVSMFVFMGGLWYGGAIGIFSSALPHVNGLDSSSVLHVVLTSVGLSQLMSNVPFVSIYLPVLHDLGYASQDTIIWMALAGASTLAGNLTILGAASNVIILEAAEKRKEKAFSFIEFLKVGSIVTAINIAILCAFLSAYSILT